MVKLDVIARRCKPLVLLKNNDIVVYSKGSLYLLNSTTHFKKKICNLPMPFAKRILSHVRLFERVFRWEPRTAVPLNEHSVLVSFQGCMYRVDLDSGTANLEHQFRNGVNNPLNVCTILGINGFSDCIAYGEYSGNSNKDSVCIYKRGMHIEDQWEKAYEFPENTITHIHSIVPDSYRNGVLILTGDADSESGIWIARNNFKEVQPLLVGKQQYRACCAFPLKEGILYATDTPTENNYICIIKEDGEKWVRERIMELNGSCIYSAQWKKKLVFSTTVEPDSTIKGKRYWVTSKLGKGIKSDRVEVIVGDLNNGFSCIAKFRKDNWPMLLMQFGSVQFCSSSNSDALYLYPVAVKKFDNSLIAYEEGGV